MRKRIAKDNTVVICSHNFVRIYLTCKELVRPFSNEIITEMERIDLI